MELQEWIDGTFEETATDFKIAGMNILYKNEEKFLKKGVEVLCHKVKPSSVLEFGFGMGWTASQFQTYGINRHVILEPNKENYEMALDWKTDYDTDIEILNIFSWDYNGSETFDLIYDDREPVTDASEDLHKAKMEDIVSNNQWLSRNAGVKVNDIENIVGHPIAFTIDGTEYVQYLVKGLYGNS
jgi:hypothetical protein